MCPIYEEECLHCRQKKEYYSATYSEDTEVCPKCGKPMQRVFSVPQVRIFQEYTSNNIMKDGSSVTVTSEAQESRLLKENGLVKADSGTHGSPTETHDKKPLHFV